MLEPKPMNHIDAQLSVAEGLENTLKAQIEVEGQKLAELRDAIAAKADDVDDRIAALIESNKTLTGVLKSFDAVALTPNQVPDTEPLQTTRTTTHDELIGSPETADSVHEEDVTPTTFEPIESTESSSYKGGKRSGATR